MLVITLIFDQIKLCLLGQVALYFYTNHKYAFIYLFTTKTRSQSLYQQHSFDTNGIVLKITYGQPFCGLVFSVTDMVINNSFHIMNNAKSNLTAMWLILRNDHFQAETYAFYPFQMLH